MIKDSIYNQKFSEVKLPRLKGKVKITLHNPTTGKNEVVEGENIVTNAVRDIMAANYMGCLDYSKMFPLWQKWFGGILCYQNPHSSTGGVIDPDDYYAYSEDQNPLTAHAGGTIIDAAHDDNAKRGNPATLSFVFTDTSVKQVWEWTPSHGNGTISALSLTHSDTGDAGLGSDSYMFRNFQPFDSIGNISPLPVEVPTSTDRVFAQYDDNHGLQFFIGDNTGNDWEFYNTNTSFQTNDITVVISKLPYKKAGLFETMFSKNEPSRKFKVSTSITFYSNPCFFFDYENKYLWVFTNATATGIVWDKSEVRYSVIDCENEEEVDHGTITSDTANLAPLGVGFNTTYDSSKSKLIFYGIAKDGDYIYFPTSTSPETFRLFYMNCTGFKKINLNNQSEQESISFNEVQQNFTTPIRCGELLANSGRIVNNGIGYTCNSQLPNISNYETFNKFSTWLPSQFNKASSLIIPLSNFETSSYPNNFLNRYLFASKLLNTTKFNLPSPVIKTSAQSMTIEYTLSEVSE